MTEQHATEHFERSKTEKVIERRRLLARAAAVVAGMMATRGVNVAAYTGNRDGQALIIGANSFSSGNTANTANGPTQLTDVTNGNTSAADPALAAVSGLVVDGRYQGIALYGDALGPSAAGVLGTSGIGGKGIKGISSSIGFGPGAAAGFGVYGESSGYRAIGVYGIADGFAPSGVRGDTGSDNGTGVLGSAAGNNSVGVEGYGPNGVKGYTAYNNGVGVFGESQSQTGGTGVWGQTQGGGSAVLGTIPATDSGANTIAVYGANNAPAANSHGVVGVAAVGHGLVGTTNYTPPPGGGPPYYAGLVGFGPNGANAGNFYGNVSITGTLNGHTAVMQHANLAVAHPDGTHRLSYALASTESWIEDAGKGTLTNGQATIKIAPDFAALADTSDYHIFLTAHGDYHLHAAEMKADAFVVRVTSAGGGTQPTGGAPVGVSQVAKAGSGAGTFSWKVMAKRKDGQAERLATYTFPNIQAPHIPDPPKAAEPGALPKKP